MRPSKNDSQVEKFYIELQMEIAKIQGEKHNENAQI